MKVIQMKMSDGKTVFTHVWEPEGDVKGVVQISHGMAEHIMRYDHIAKYLAENGYVVIGDDHRAHGDTDKQTLGYSEGDIFSLTLHDLSEITEYAKKTYPNKKIVLFGHSYGSFLSQAYIQEYGNLIDGVILGGSAKMTGAVPAFGRLVANIGCVFKGKKAPANMLKKASFDAYDKQLKGGSFISSVDEETERYLKDKYCAFTCSMGFYKYFFKAFTRIYKKKNLNKIDKNKPIYIISGEQDPVGDCTKSTDRLYRTYRDLGVKDVAVKYYKGARHEYLNDVSRPEAFNDILTFVNKVCQ